MCVSLFLSLVSKVQSGFGVRNYSDSVSHSYVNSPSSYRQPGGERTVVVDRGGIYTFGVVVLVQHCNPSPKALWRFRANVEGTFHFKQRRILILSPISFLRKVEKRRFETLRREKSDV